ncbi:MAG: 3-deoxy-7-phosphoheptulonate synthase [Elusimicrobia bacterium]|nr:3-deoxy-7-phosphoheptulonate synthase [Elusimicrobiota bacterium]MBP9127790.1 3-deoxy-7-phosphoheptulonate synthase [Elusimicrobiota bacterium]MBP9699001.1 3-deoxy-7-phosphoheptulonate synthase [Elusimicrobiota bacterium]
MIVTLKSGAKKSDVQAVVARVKKLGFTPQLSRGAERVVIGVIGEGNKAIAHKELFESMPQVEVVTPISKPYKVVSRVFKKTDTVIDVRGVPVGGKGIVIMAGPCSVDTRENVMVTAKELKKAGVQILRGGAFKPRTSPYAFQGLGEEALKYLAEARRVTGLPIITEVMDPRQVDLVERYADILQIGARNAQNYDLLREVGRTRKPAMLKRGMATTIEEWLMAAEYIMAKGNENVMLCERGIRTFETATRFTLDLNAVPVLKTLSHLPVLVDPSHGVGVRDYIVPMARAAIAAGADGIIIECHPNPAAALSDGHQAMLPTQMHDILKGLRKVAEAVGRTL